MEERKGFGSNFGFLMAAIGSAVGLGNIWGFPNKMGANGGFTFLIIYLILAACCGFIVMMGELALGRKTGRGAIGAYRVLSKRFKWLGWLGVLSAFLILGFYCALGGYCLKYVTLNVGNLFHAGFGTGTLDGAGVFGALMANQGEAVIYGLIFVALTMIIVMGGVGGGIEKVCSVGMPALFVMLVICIIRSCTLEGASDGLKYMFVPGWALANGVIKEAPDFFSVVSTAGGQMFFSLSLGMAAMITYGSYLDKKENLQKNAIIIVVMDTLVALMAGLCVIPGRFALDPTGNLGGPSLLFVTMQNVFDRMGAAGPIFGILFYLLVVFAAVSSPSPCWRPLWPTLWIRPGTRARATSASSTPSSAPSAPASCASSSAWTLWATPVSPRPTFWACVWIPPTRCPPGAPTGWTSLTASPRAF